MTPALLDLQTGENVLGPCPQNPPGLNYSNCVIPEIKDGYSALFWMDYRDDYVPGGDSDDRGYYPYLGWACDHFHGVKKSPISNHGYPLTWEQRASQANYPSLQVLDPIYVEEKLSAPHTWHAVEVFLHLIDAE